MRVRVRVPDRRKCGEIEAPLLCRTSRERCVPCSSHAETDIIRSSANLQLSIAEEDVMQCINLVVYISRPQGLRRRVDDVLRVQKSA